MCTYMDGLTDYSLRRGSRLDVRQIDVVFPIEDVQRETIRDKRLYWDSGNEWL
jgi:hypothetical protein